MLIDNLKAAKEATRHLMQQGCRKIAHITTPSRHNVYLDRIQGYKEDLAEVNIPFNERLLIYNTLNFDAGIEAAAIIQKMSSLPEGVFVTNDNCAVSCIRALEEGGIRIPEDIAFVGFNNDSIARVFAPALRINYPRYDMGKMAMQCLMDALNNNRTSQITDTVMLCTDLIIRNSSIKK